MEYAKRYFEEVQAIAKTIDLNVIEKMVQIIETAKKQKGRLFFYWSWWKCCKLYSCS